MLGYAFSPASTVSTPCSCPCPCLAYLPALVPDLHQSGSTSCPCPCLCLALLLTFSLDALFITATTTIAIISTCLSLFQYVSSLPFTLFPLSSFIAFQHFSQDMQHVVTTLLSGKAAASQVCRLISERINEEFDSAMAASDALHR